ncbi:uncharacterized protein LOC129962431 [Argiope bruennichi]|uniref:uncharacterized protein LOC129962431 n=1 Tax=Argiope bruennichi TaxID=94029 RepID=UPI0024945124|nr:uncharacterized protein LOC129962431 [Argiope bruennichi]
MRCCSGSPETLQIAQGKLFILWNIVLEKYLALFDTIFFVLRKKQNQISFLHVYHHIVTCLLVTWIGAAPDLSAVFAGDCVYNYIRWYRLREDDESTDILCFFRRQHSCSLHHFL